MTTIHAFELNLITAFQGDGRFQQVMNWFSYLGYEAFLYVLPFVYFVLSRRAGARLYLLLSLTGLWIHVLKLAFHLPRPFWIDTRVQALCGSGGYGLPSGHVLAASVVWWCVAKSIRTPWASLVAVVAVLLVSISRIYLGVHFVSDVIAAWVAAAVLLWWFRGLYSEAS